MVTAANTVLEYGAQATSPTFIIIKVMIFIIIIRKYEDDHDYDFLKENSSDNIQTTYLFISYLRVQIEHEQRFC